MLTVHQLLLRDLIGKKVLIPEGVRTISEASQEEDGSPIMAFFKEGGNSIIYPDLCIFVEDTDADDIKRMKPIYDSFNEFEFQKALVKSGFRVDEDKFSGKTEFTMSLGGGESDNYINEQFNESWVSVLFTDVGDVEVRVCCEDNNHEINSLMTAAKNINDVKNLYRLITGESL